ncbi:hypothetical protein V6N11_064464 [Hibiscus sabdariffa]|uniref:Uncharacterized protein n=1 Tax=Hibiscus sabdariffa TaxID=183260 RepID=A0ABR2P9C7_9ROSI
MTWLTENVQDGSRVNLAHEEVAAVPRVENGESAKQGLKSGDHMAVSIIEHELNGNPRDIHDGQRGKIVSGKGKIDVSRNNVQIHRNSDLDMVQAHDQPGGSRGRGVLYNFEPMLHSSNDETFYRSNSP